ncbi:MAG: Maf family protein [Myxococcota bacterium]
MNNYNNNCPKVVLASTSRYKKRLLSRLCIEFDSVSPEIEENIDPEESPESNILRLSREKATVVAANNPDAVVISSDQAVALEGRLFGKPQTFEGAKKQLLQLQGNTYKLITAVTVIHGDKKESSLEIHHMTMKPLKVGEIARYLVKDRPLDSAGSYKIEGLGISLFSSISGNDPVAIMGLPMIALIKILKNFKVDIP